ncbi:MAG: hypothetical protein WCJ30_00330 [Deltaproteobacteria bacterium]
MKRRDGNAFAVSAAVHALVVGGVIAYARTHPVDFVFDTALQTIEFDLATGPLDMAGSATSVPTPALEEALTAPPAALQPRARPIAGPSGAAAPATRGAHAGPSGYGTTPPVPENPASETTSAPPA